MDGFYVNTHPPPPPTPPPPHPPPPPPPPHPRVRFPRLVYLSATVGEYHGGERNRRHWTYDDQDGLWPCGVLRAHDIPTSWATFQSKIPLPQCCGRRPRYTTTIPGNAILRLGWLPAEPRQLFLVGGRGSEHPTASGRSRPGPQGAAFGEPAESTRRGRCCLMAPNYRYPPGPIVEKAGRLHPERNGSRHHQSPCGASRPQGVSRCRQREFSHDLRGSEVPRNHGPGRRRTARSGPTARALTDANADSVPCPSLTCWRAPGQTPTPCRRSGERLAFSLSPGPPRCGILPVLVALALP